MNKLLAFLIFTLVVFAESHSQQMNYQLIDSVCMNSVVQIATPNATGSGFLVNSSGYIITNCHVIDGAFGYFASFEESDIRIKFKNGRLFQVKKIVDYDIEHDLALIKIQNVNISALPLYNGSLTNGVTVGALGNPLGSEFTITSGIISNMNPFEQGEKYFQLSTPINPGNSGGPVVNMYGQVVGVVVATLNEEYFRGQQAMNLAIQLGHVRKLLDANQVTFSTKPFIDPLQLKIREQLTNEEKRLLDSIGVEQVKAQMQLQKMQQEHERQMESKRAEQERAMQELRNIEEKRLLQEQYDQRRQIQSQQAKYEVQKVLDQRTTARSKTVSDSIRVEQLRINFIQEKNAFVSGLPYRMVAMVGAAGSWPIGAMGVVKKSYPIATYGIGPFAWMGYRIDISKRSARDRFGKGTVFGIGIHPSFKTGSFFNHVQDSTQTISSQASSFNMEVEGGVLFKETFKLTGGYTWSNADLLPSGYPFMRAALIIKMHPIIWSMGASATLTAPQDMIWYSAETALGFRMGFGKWQTGMRRKVVKKMASRP